MELKPNNETDNIHNAIIFSRYLTPQKILDFLLNKHIPFTRLDKFDDIIEGMTNAQLQKLDYAIDVTKADNPALSDLDSLRKAGLESIKKIDSETLSIQKGHYVSCWFCGDWESTAMWELYSNKDGFRISINASTLFNFIKQYVKTLNNDDYLEFAYGFVDYRKLRPYSIDTHSKNKFRAFKKDLCYEHEKEFRFIAVRNPLKKDENLLSYNIGIENIINEFKIICHPSMENWKKENIKKIIKILNYSIKVEDSNIRTL
jgi:hypothetical protein